MTSLTALRGYGLLRVFDEAGVLSVADVQVANRLATLVGETDESAVLAAALVVRGTRHGSVVLDLMTAAATISPDADDDELVPPVELPWPPAGEWVAACARSRLVADAAGGSPLHMVGSRLWLDRYWRQESQVAHELRRRRADTPADLDPTRLKADLNSLFAEDVEEDQRHATSLAARSRVSVIAGGPGTGKTTTIARLVTVLRRQHPNLRIALAAPTGKAAARLEEALHSAAGPLTDAERGNLARLSASTLHRLLGRRPGVASRFRHNRENRLPFDVVIVDECSMVSLTLMSRLLEALAPAGRLVLVGDPDQLASVEAGAVLADLVDAEDGSTPMPSSVALLRTVHRFEAGGSIAQLAQHVRAGRADEALELLHGQVANLSFYPVPDDQPIAGIALAALQEQTRHEVQMIAAARAGDVLGALDALDRHRLLCAHRSGPRGVRHWSDTVERWLAADDPLITPRLDGRYAGQGLLVTVNDYENGLYNGDTGVIVQQGDDLVAAFRRGGNPAVFPLVRLSDVRPLYVMTVHRAQGSQFDEVTVLMPYADSPLATRQTFYTAITRASQMVRIIGSDAAVLACIRRPASRATGLRERLAGTLEQLP